MPIGFGSSLGSLNASIGINQTQRTLAESMRKLASGKSIMGAADNPAGYVITEKMNATLVGLSSAATQNESSINMLRTAESSMGKMSDMLLKARQLVVDTMNEGGNDFSVKKANQAQFDELFKSLQNVADTAQFGSKKLLDGSLNLTAMTDANGATTQVPVPDMGTANLGKGASYDATLQGEQPVTQFANLADVGAKTGDQGVLATGSSDQLKQTLAVIDKAIGDVAGARGQLGAAEADSLQPTIDSLRTSYQNLQESQSNIADTDYAKETAKSTGDQIKMQVKLALMAQGKENANTLLQLLM